MSYSFSEWIINLASKWLTKPESTSLSRDYLSDFNRVCREIKIGDLLLIEGNNRVSSIIRHITQSVWTHAVLYIGRLHEIQNEEVRQWVRTHISSDPNTQLLIESQIGTGTIITPLQRYKKFHVRLLRPNGLTGTDAQLVINNAMKKLGTQYDVRQLLDLARFLFPWGLYPRRWRSSLFEHNAQQPTKDICSSMIAEAFESVDYPILPLIDEDYEKKIEFIRRNVRLYTPSDFDYSPYFAVIKYPFFPLGHHGSYHELPWAKDVISDDEGQKVVPILPAIQQFLTSPAFAVIGASKDRTKFGNKVLRCYLQHHKKVYPVNPHEESIEGVACVHRIADLPETVKSISVVTPPAITERVVEDAIAKGVKNIWLQPGAESRAAIEKCKKQGVNVISDGPCVLRELGFRD